MHEITLILPLPAGKGVGGAERKGKAGLAGDKQGKPPAALAIPAPGERTISNAAVACDGIVPSPPVPPLLGYRHCS